MLASDNYQASTIPLLHTRPSSQNLPAAGQGQCYRLEVLASCRLALDQCQHLLKASHEGAGLQDLQSSPAPGL